MRRFSAATLILLVALTARQALADDVFFQVALDKLPLTEGRLPETKAEENWRYSDARASMRPYAVLDGAGEAYLAVDGETEQPWSPGGPAPTLLAFRTQQAGSVSGGLYLAKSDGTGMVLLKFNVPAEQVAEARKKLDAKTFFRAKHRYYELLLNAGLPGGAWFRHQAHQAAAEMGDAKESADAISTPQRPADLDDTYTLFTGGRAVSENLQLDRVLRATTQSTTPESKDVDLKTIEGITIAAMDWTPLVKDLKPELDPLAVIVPGDQHAIFFPSFQAMTSVMDEAERTGLPVLQHAETSSQDAMTRQRYERQLGVSVNALSRLLGPQLINSIAITGSDPYLRVGSDLALVMEPKNARALRTLLETEIATARQRETLGKAVDGSIGGIAYSGAESPDRTLRSYVAQVGDAIVLTNSLVQLGRIVAAQKGDEPSLARQPEYTFFRDRYRRGDGEETGLLVLSDATIRRWCGSRWRIADSRRTRAAAVMSELQAASMDSLARRLQPGDGALHPDFATPDMGKFTLSWTGVHCSVYGRLDRMTPIAELPLEHITPAEAEAYTRWRETYQQNWRQYFDPIAVRFGIAEKKLSADVTVMPLIAGTDYRQFLELTRGVTFAADAGDPHDTLLHLIIAFNRQAQSVRGAENMASTMVPGLKVEPFSWIGKSIAFYADDDPFWDEMTAAKESEDFLEKNFHRLPVALRVEVSNGLKLAGFLMALRGFIDQTVPQMTVWENLQHNDRSYVKITPSETARGQNKELANAAVYYVVTGDSLLMTLSEPLLNRALDREAARGPATRAANPSPAPATQSAQPWLGSSVALRATAKVFELLMHTGRQTNQAMMQSLAWGNLPVLNEWKRHFADQDPIALHERVWGVRLTDPAGGTYTWNDRWQTMESSLYGHPGEPREGPLMGSAWKDWTGGSFGLTFEEHGLRARAHVDRGTSAR